VECPWESIFLGIDSKMYDIAANGVEITEDRAAKYDFSTPYAYLRTALIVKGDNEDETTGIAIIKRALEEPLRQIVENAGLEGSVVVNKVKEGKNDFGFNARTEVYENLLTTGVIDPVKVSRVALENAASIAGMLLTTECVISNHKEPTPPTPPMPMGGGMDGMM